MTIPVKIGCIVMAHVVGTFPPDGDSLIEGNRITAIYRRDRATPLPSDFGGVRRYPLVEAGQA